MRHTRHRRLSVRPSPLHQAGRRTPDILKATVSRGNATRQIVEQNACISSYTREIELAFYKLYKDEWKLRFFLEQCFSKRVPRNPGLPRSYARGFAKS